MSEIIMRYGARGSAGAAITPASIGAFDLGAGTVLTAGTDLDGLDSPGTYFCSNGTEAADLLNAPQTSYGFKLIVMASADNQMIQMAITNVGACTVYLRRLAGSTWGTWRHINTTT